MTTWIDPFREFGALAREMERLMGGRSDARLTFPSAGASFRPGRRERAYPLLNVNEDNDAIYVEALAPGVDPKSLEVAVENGRLTLSGVKPGLEAEPEAFHRSERSTGRFVRSFELPAEVDREKVKAEFKNGQLLVTLPKAEIAKARRISVSVA